MVLTESLNISQRSLEGWLESSGVFFQCVGDLVVLACGRGGRRDATQQRGRVEGRRWPMRVWPMLTSF